jgi:hypothetical protein
MVTLLRAGDDAAESGECEECRIVCCKTACLCILMAHLLAGVAPKLDKGTALQRARDIVTMFLVAKDLWEVLREE